MLDERKAAILRAVVEEYIETAQPVGSAGAVARRTGSKAQCRRAAKARSCPRGQGALHGV